MTTTEDLVRRAVILRAIGDERVNQISKFGDQKNHSLDRWNTILTEELGEVARSINEQDDENLKLELIQVAAVCVAWLESLR